MLYTILRMAKIFLSQLLSRSEMVRKAPEIDWQATPVGALESWSLSLTNSVSLVLESGIPMALYWGKQFTQFYNDAFSSLIDRRMIQMPALREVENVWKKINSEGEAVTYRELSYSPVRDDDGNIQGLLLIFREHLEYKEVSQKFEAIFSESKAAMALLHGPEFVFEKVNQKFVEIIGENSLLGKPFLSVLPEFLSHSFYQLMKGVLDSGISFTASELLLSTPGKEMYLDVSLTRLESGEGKPDSLYIHAVDNTEKVLARKNIEVALKARDEFISIASHELKTPLTSLKLQSQIQRRLIQKNDPRGLEAERIRQFSESTDLQIIKLNRLVDDMLDISRIKSGNLTINPDIVDLSKLILTVIDDMRTHFTVNNFPVISVSQEIVGTWDALRIEQVIANLLTNAIRYGLDRPIMVEALKANGLATVKVRDHGIGISKDHHEKIFNRFERINPKEVSGLGLGLFLTKQIIEAHNGTITVESDLGKGSTFTVELPLNHVFPPGLYRSPKP